MAFKIASSPTNAVSWYPIDANGTLYHGQIIESQGDGVAEIDVASGAFDTTGNTKILGIIEGDNNEIPVYDATYKVDKITGVASQANQIARNWDGQEGHMYPKGEPQPLVQVALIGPHTVIEGPIKNADIDTAPMVLTTTTGDTTGVGGMVTNACEHTPVADFSTMYCRTGANRGLYRITQDTSTVSPTNTVAWPYDVAIGDTFIRVPLRQVLAFMYIDSLGMYVDNSATPAGNYYGVNVVDMDLSTAGEEKVWFTFAPVHFGRD